MSGAARQSTVKSSAVRHLERDREKGGFNKKSKFLNMRQMKNLRLVHNKCGTIKSRQDRASDTHTLHKINSSASARHMPSMPTVFPPAILDFGLDRQIAITCKSQLWNLSFDSKQLPKGAFVIHQMLLHVLDAVSLCLCDANYYFASDSEYPDKLRSSEMNVGRNTVNNVTRD
jgi:hypothetical protein